MNALCIPIHHPQLGKSSLNFLGELYLKLKFTFELSAVVALFSNDSLSFRLIGVDMLVRISTAFREAFSITKTFRSVN